MLKKVAAGFAIAFVIACFWLFEGDFPIDEVDAKYANAASEFLQMPDGTRVHYRDEGRPGAPAVVLIHGSNASLQTWEPWVAELGEDYRVVTLDLPGHGLTGRTLVDDYSTETYVAVVKALVEHLQLRTFVLGGNSMGGGVTWRYTLAHPGDVRALILVDASGLPTWRRTQTTGQTTTAADGESRSTPLAFSLLRQPWFQGIARYIDPYLLVAQGLKASHYDPTFVDDALIARYYDLSMRAGTRDATLKRFSSWRGGAEVPTWDLGEIKQPSLILWGAADAVIPSSVGDRFAQALPDARLIVYPQIGHIPMEEIAVQSAADVREFLREIMF